MSDAAALGNNGATPGATANASTEYLNLKVKSQEGEEIFFKIKKSTQFKKLMDAYCQRAQVSKILIKRKGHAQREG